MAVFTEVSDDAIARWLGRYRVGALRTARGIAEGIENTNYFVDTEAGAWVLTLIERIPAADLPFHLRLMKHLAGHGIRCPEPLTDRDGGLWSRLAGKPATLVTRLPGRPVEHPDAGQCRAVGQVLARMHLAAADFGPAPANTRGLGWWPSAAAALAPHLAGPEKALLDDELAAQLAWAATPAWQALPASAVHADLFRDNVLFDAQGIPGVIDFYFACEDKWLFDLAVACNDWCIDDASGELDPPRTAALLDGYRGVRLPSPDEAAAWPMMLRAAALRFWLSRLYDRHLPRDAQMLQPKDPTAFERILHRRRDGRIPPLPTAA